MNRSNNHARGRQHYMDKYDKFSPSHLFREHDDLYINQAMSSTICLTRADTARCVFSLGNDYRSLSYSRPVTVSVIAARTSILIGKYTVVTK